MIILIILLAQSAHLGKEGRIWRDGSLSKWGVRGCAAEGGEGRDARAGGGRDGHDLQPALWAALPGGEAGAGPGGGA